MKFKRLGTAILMIVLQSFFITAQAAGQTSMDTINATVKISICGNGIIEGGEDCEGADLNSKTCTSLGYDSGNLSCDISCSFDSMACFKNITDSNSIVSSPGSSPSTSTNAQTYAPESANFRVSPIYNLITPSLRASSGLACLSERLKIFDINKNCKLDKQELNEIMTMWTNSWKETAQHAGICDIDGNNDCGLEDFSILLYYIER